MPAPKVRADYSALKLISQSFCQEAEAISRLIQANERAKRRLEAGDWVGQGARAFYAEMDSNVLPKMRRLVNALEEASRTTLRIEQAMHQAEDEAGRVLRMERSALPAGVAAGIAAGLGGRGGGAFGAGTASGSGGAQGATNKPSAWAEAFRPGPLGDIENLSNPPGPAMAPPASGVIPNTLIIPNLSGIGYPGMPVAGGRHARGTGYGPAVAIWRANAAKFAELVHQEQLHLEELKRLFASARDRRSAEVNAAAARDLPKNVGTLNRLTGGKVFDLIQAYGRYRGLASGADRDAAGLTKDLHAAMEDEVGAVAAVKQYEAAMQRNSLEARRQALEARIGSRRGLVDQAIKAGQAAAQGTSGLTDYAKEKGVGVVKAILDVMNEKELAELDAVGTRIEALNKAIDAEEGVARKTVLQAARSRAEAAFDHYVAKKMEAHVWEAAQWGALDQLARLEQDHHTGTMFRELQEYNSQMRWVGSDLRHQTEAYISRLESPPFSEAGRYAQMVGEDVRFNRVYGGAEDARWEAAAQGTQRSLQHFEQWRQTELANHRQLRDDMINDQHLAMVDDTLARAEQALGGTVRQDHL
jgi:WXG100 family type VII secretion target